MAKVEDIAAQALTLELKDRARLAEELLRSLDDLSEKEIEELWAEVAEHRLAEFRAGKSRAVPAHEVLQKAEELVR